MGKLVQDIDETGYKGRADRSIQSGRVISVNRTDNTCVLDVGMIDANGNPVPLIDVPFSPQSPPHSQDTVAIVRTSSSPYSMVVGAGAQVGGANSGQVVTAGGAVSSIKKTGESSGQQGDIILDPGTNVTIVRTGKTFTIGAAGASLSPATTVTEVDDTGVVGTSVDYAREDHVHKGVHSLAESGGTALYGDVTISGAGGIAINQTGNDLEIDGSGIAGAVTSVAVDGEAPITGDVTFTGVGGIVLNQAGDNIEIDGSGAGGGGGSVISDGYQYTDGWYSTYGYHQVLRWVDDGVAGSLSHTLGGLLAPGLPWVQNTVIVVNDSGVVLTILPDGTDTIDGIGTLVLRDGDRVTLVGNFSEHTDGNWSVVARGQRSGPDYTLPAQDVTSTTYTLVLLNAGMVVECDNASAITVTVPPVSSVSWPIGTVLEIFQYGAGQVTIAPDSGVTLRSDGAKLKTAGQYATIALRMRAFDEWVLSGDLAA